MVEHNYNPISYLDEYLKDKIGVYQIRNIIDNKIYIGSSSNLYKRKKQHFSDLLSNRHENKYLQNAYNKYGLKNFVFEIIEICNENIKYRIEQYWLDKFYDKQDMCYNINPIASKPPLLKGEKNHNFGKKLPKEVIEKRKKTIFENNTFKGENNPMYGRTGANNSLSIKFISLVDNKIYDGFREFVRITGKSRITVRKHCQNKLKNRERLYMYLDDYNKLSKIEKENMHNKAINERRYMYE